MHDGQLAGMTLLVVEDEYLIALDVQRMIEETGAEAVLLASSIAEVRKLLVDGPRIDATVLDLRLGKEDATPLISAFIESGIPLVVATGFGDRTPDGVPRLAKPYRETELIEAILHLVRS